MTSDPYTELRMLSYKTYRNAIKYSEISICKIDGNLTLSDKAQIEACFVAFALELLKENHD